MQLDALDDKCLEQIFSYLSTSDILQSVRRVNQFWYQISFSKRLFKNVSFAEWEHLSDENISRFLASIGEFVENLDISRCSSLSSQIGLKSILKCVNLKYLNLSDTACDDLALLHILKCCSLLTHVDISFCNDVANASVWSRYIPSGLCKFMTRDVRVNLFDIFLHIQLETRPKLQETTLKSEDFQLANESSLILADEFFTWLDSIMYLHIYDDNIDNEDLLERPIVLSNLYGFFAHKVRISDKVVQALAEHSPKLEIFSVDSCTQATDVGVGYLAKRCPNIKVLNVAGSQSSSANPICSGTLTNNGLFSISSYLTKLESINLMACDRISDEGILRLQMNLRFLRSLVLTGCISLKNKTLIDFVEACPLLEEVDLTECMYFNHYGLRKYISGLPNLRVFKSSSCPMIGSLFLQDSDFTSPPNPFPLHNPNWHPLSNLRNLDLSFCPRLDDRALSYLAVYCKQLIELNLYACSEISDDGIEDIVNECKQLESLDLSCCRSKRSQLTDKSLEHIEKLKYLRELYLTGCLLFTVDRIVNLASNSPNLRTLQVSVIRLEKESLNQRIHNECHVRSHHDYAPDLKSREATFKYLLGRRYKLRHK